MNAISYKFCEIFVVQYGFSIEFIENRSSSKNYNYFSFSFSFNRNHSNAIDNEENRYKRGVVELYSMVKCSTGCDPLIYKGYGCYCGFLGRGRALDGIDRYDYKSKHDRMKLKLPPLSTHTFLDVAKCTITATKRQIVTNTWNILSPTFGNATEVVRCAVN